MTVAPQHTNPLVPPLVNPIITIEYPPIVVVDKHYKNPDNSEVKNPDKSRILNPRRRKVTLKTDRAFGRTGTLTCSNNGSANAPRIRFFTKADSSMKGDAEIRIDGTHNILLGDELTAGKDIYVEGAHPSAALDDIELKLELSTQGVPVGPPATAKMTCIELTLDICQERDQAQRPLPAAAAYAARAAYGPNPTASATNNATVTAAAANQAQQDKASGEMEKAAAEGKINTAQGKINTAQGKINTAQGKINTAQGKINTAQGKINTAQGKINTAQGKIDTTTRNARDAKALADKKTKGFTSHFRSKKAKQALTDAANTANQEKANAEQEKADAEQEKTNAEQEKATAEQEKTNAEQEKTNAEQEKTNAEQEKTNAEQEKSAAQNKIQIANAQITAATPVPLPTPDKVTKGRYLHKQTNPINNARRAMLIVHKAKPDVFAGKLVLTPLNAEVVVFEKEYLTWGETTPANPSYEMDNATIPAQGLQLWVQGAGISNDLRDTGFRLGLKIAATGTHPQFVETDGDMVKATVFSLEFVLGQQPAPRAAQANDPTTDFVRFGLWDRAYNGGGSVKNQVSDNENFVSSDTRRFFLRLCGPRANPGWTTDPSGPLRTVQINWLTRTANWSVDDAPASQLLTLVETSANSNVYISKAVMLVTDDTDCSQSVNTGLTAQQGDAGNKTRGQSSHRLRKAHMDGFVEAEYPPGAVGAGMSAYATLFNRNPDERKRVAVRVVRYTGAPGGTAATAGYIASQFSIANERWNSLGLQVDMDGAITDRPVPATALNGTGLYEGSCNSPHERAVLADLIPITPDNTLTAVFVPLTGYNAYATVGQRTYIGLDLQDRFFIFIDANLDLNNETLAHELHHVLHNRFDEDVACCYISFNTEPPLAYGVALPDVRVERRYHNQHSPDPDNDAGSDNVINWFRRTRTARYPSAGALTPAPDATTGNLFTQPY